jgi:hypothetical protein
VIVEVLAANAGAGVDPGIVAPAKYAGIRNVVWQEVAKPVDAIASGPCLYAVAIKAMDGDDAGSRTGLAE